jgi:hypothetical protein
MYQEREGIPSVTGFFVEDLLDVELKPWARMGALGSFLNLGEERTRFEIKSGSIYSPGDLMYHGHFNTGHGTMRHFAMRGRSPKYSQDRFRTKLHEMIPFDEEPREIHPMYLEELGRKGVKSEVSVVEE